MNQSLDLSRTSQDDLSNRNVILNPDKDKNPVSSYGVKQDKKNAQLEEENKGETATEQISKSMIGSVNKHLE